jgi:hypothetical protein
MKFRLFAIFALLTLVAATAQAQSAKVIGTSGTGGYLQANVFDRGYIRDDSAIFNNGTGAANSEMSTIWNLYFGMYDGTNQWWADAAPAHTNQITVGTPSNPSATEWSNTVTFSGNANLTAR